MTAMPALSTPTQIAILTAMDPTQMSLDGLLVHYNELVAASGQGSPRNAKFRDKPTGVKAVRGLLVQIAATTDLPEDEAPTPGLRRLRAAPQAEAIRNRVLQDQEDATRLAVKGRDRAPPVRETDPVPVQGRQARTGFTDNLKITVLVTENPKRGASATRFAHYYKSPTVADYIAATGNRRKALQDLGWDVAKGFIEVVG